MAGNMVMVEPSPARVLTAYEAELTKTRRDISALELISRRDSRDSEKRVRLAYRQFHQASLTGNEDDFKAVRETITGVLRDFGPKEDICLLKANLDGRFHCLEEVKQDLRTCPALAGRHAGRSILADVDFQEGRYEQARLALETLIQENRTWDNLARLAHWKGKMGQPEEADRLYEEAGNELTAKELRSFAWLELQRGALAISRGRCAKARKHYWHTDEHLAGLLAAEGKLDEALTLLEGVVERAPKPELKQALGELLAFMGRTEEARPWLEAAEAAFLASAQAGAVHYYHHLADLYADTGGQPAEAVKWARKDVALRSNFSTQSALAWALLQNGEATEGLEWIQRALSSGVQDGGIFATASSLFHTVGDAAQGEHYARAATEINPNGHSFHMHH
jgi:tetratricopeptide (TPR) repeat protein